jgi:C-terminal processing protease CtpA/Prc
MNPLHKHLCYLFVLGVALIFANDVKAQMPLKDQPDMAIDAEVRNKTITVLLKTLQNEYTFPEVAQVIVDKMAARQAKGSYEEILSAKQFAATLTADLQEDGKDRHLRVVYDYRDRPISTGPRKSSPEEFEQEIARMRAVNFGFEEVKRLEHNIGYINLQGFYDPKFGAETVAAAMNLVADTDALIIDLRENGGGNPGMVRLICSYFFNETPVHLNDLAWRNGTVDEFWTLRDISGKRYKNPVYLLTSNRTFSGAEEFAYDLKNLKRAVVVGEITGGGANPGHEFALVPHFAAFIPTGRAINPITKTSWEGTGVEPDILATKESALQIAIKTAIKNAVK